MPVRAPSSGSPTVFFGGGGVSPGGTSVTTGGGGTTPGFPVGTVSNLEIFNVRVPPNNVPNDGSAASALINAIVAGIAGARATIYFPPGTYGLDANVTFPANIRLWMAKGAVFRPIAANIVLTINGDIDFPTDAAVIDTSLFPLTVTFGSLVDIAPQWWGATGDGVHDDYPATAAALAALPNTGGAVVFPMTKSNTYFFSQSLHLQKLTRLSGAITGQPVPAGAVGTVLLFAADQTGIYVEGRDTFGDTFTFPNPRSAAGLGGAEFSIVENLTILSAGGQTGLSGGGTGAPCDGVRIRAGQVKLRNLWIDGFHRNGVRIWATSGSGDPTLNGNANLWRMDNVNINRSGSDGFSVFGTDSNQGKAILCDSDVNGGRGYYDGSFLGNSWDNCHTSGNTGRCYETDNPNCRSGFYNCYVEGAGGLTAAQQARLLSPAFAIGGMLATDPGTLTTDSTALVITSDGRVVRGNLHAVNSKGTVTIQTRLGKDDANMIALSFGTSDTNIPLEDMEVAYDAATNWYSLRDNGSPTRDLISWPNRLQIALRQFAVAFRNGFYFGVPGSASMMAVNMANAPPVAGTWNVGDRLFNTYAISGPATGIEHWFCLVAGTPGTWVPNRAFGSMQLAAAVSTQVATTAARAGSRIFFWPTNPSAALLEQGTKKLYRSAIVDGVSFTVSTQDATAAAGTETFDYVIFN